MSSEKKREKAKADRVSLFSLHAAKKCRNVERVEKQASIREAQEQLSKAKFAGLHPTNTVDLIQIWPEKKFLSLRIVFSRLVKHRASFKR